MPCRVIAPLTPRVASRALPGGALVTARRCAGTPVSSAVALQSGLPAGAIRVRSGAHEGCDERDPTQQLRVSMYRSRRRCGPPSLPAADAHRSRRSACAICATELRRPEALGSDAPAWSTGAKARSEQRRSTRCNYCRWFVHHWHCPGSHRCMIRRLPERTLHPLGNMQPSVAPLRDVPSPPVPDLAPAQSASEDERSYYRLSRRVYGSWFASIYEAITLPCGGCDVAWLGWRTSRRGCT